MSRASIPAYGGVSAFGLLAPERLLHRLRDAFAIEAQIAQQKIGFPLADERIVDSKRYCGNVRAHPCKFAQNALACSPGDHTALNRDDKRQFRRLADGIYVEGLHPAHIDDTHLDALGGEGSRRLFGSAHHAPEREDGRIGSLAHKPALAQLERLGFRGNLDALGLAARIPDRKRSAHRKRRAQRSGQLGLV